MDFKKVHQSNNVTKTNVKLRQLFDIFEYSRVARPCRNMLQ